MRVDPCWQRGTIDALAHRQATYAAMGQQLVKCHDTLQRLRVEVCLGRYCGKVLVFHRRPFPSGCRS